tara:strand:- start:254 stop:655 length:402 start_codon:yes stop_codon:yes gene_type:complete
MEINHLAILIIYLIKKKEEPQKLPDDLIKLIMDINTKEIKEEKHFVNYVYHQKKHKILMKELKEWNESYTDCFEDDVITRYTFYSYTLEGIYDGGGWGNYNVYFRLEREDILQPPLPRPLRPLRHNNNYYLYN